MLKNYLTVALRNLRNNKAYSFINIGGLAMGMTIAMFIGLWIFDELSFNKYHKNYDHIAKLWNGGTNPDNGKIDGGPAMQYEVATTLKSRYSHFFKHVVRAVWIGDYLLSTGDEKFSKVGEFMEPDGIEMLSLKMIEGNYKSLEDPHSIILSQSTAKTMFGDEDPMDKHIRIANQMDAKVTGIYEDIPVNGEFGAVQFFSTWTLYADTYTWIKSLEGNWDSNTFPQYVELQPELSFDDVNKSIRNIFKNNAPADFQAVVEKYKMFAVMVPMSKWHLYSEFENGEPSGGRITFIWLFGIVGAFVLMLACINFVNLSTARSEKRAKEVGVRKSIGSSKKQLVRQFLSESLLVVTLAFVLSLLLLALLQPSFNELADKDIQLPFTNVVFWMMSIAFILITGLAAGLYPAFYLSSFQPVRVLKGTLRLGRFAALPRKVLVVVQFTVSVTLIIGTIIVYQQIQFARNKPIGYNRNGLISVRLNDPEIRKNLDVLQKEWVHSGVVSSTAICSSPLTDVWNTNSGFSWPGKDPNAESAFAVNNISPEFGKTIGWKIIDGRDFSEDIASDTIDAVIINRTAAEYMGLKNPVGQKFTDLNDGVPAWSKTIIGVVDDVVALSPYYPVMQTIYYYRSEYFNVVQLRIDPSVSVHEALPKIKSVFDKIVPASYFEYSFADAEYAKKFSQEERVGNLTAVFSVLAILISCLGLFGLSSFVAEQRTKEIGIRKVMGASVGALWRMLSKDFVILVMISCFIAVPVGYWLMKLWLQKYDYHAEMSVWVFVITCGSAVLVTLATVSYQSIRSATNNPIRSLRSE